MQRRRKSAGPHAHIANDVPVGQHRDHDLRVSQVGQRRRCRPAVRGYEFLRPGEFDVMHRQLVRDRARLAAMGKPSCQVRQNRCAWTQGAFTALRLPPPR